MHWLGDAIDTLKARVDLALAGRGATLVARALQVLATMRTGVAVAPIFQDLIDEEEANVAKYRAAYQRGLHDVGALRERIEREHAEWLRHRSVDDGEAAVWGSVEAFDVSRTKNVVDDRLAVLPGERGEHEAEHMRHLVAVINGWIPNQEEYSGEDWATPYLEVKDRWEFALRQRRLQVPEAAAAAARLLKFATTANEESPRTADGILGWLPLGTGPYGALYEEYLGVPMARDHDAQQGRLKAARRALRADLRIVGAELRFRMLDVRSTSRLLLHLKHRCEAFTAAELRAATLNAYRKEDVLRDACAAFLFDAGVPVVTEVSIARLRADVIGAPIYVETKQYSSASAGIPKAARQVWSTLARLRGSPQGSQIRDAYCLIFRLSGDAPIYDLPSAPIHFAGFRVYFLLIDIAAAAEAGSQEKKPAVPLSADQLLPPSDDSLEGEPEPYSAFDSAPEPVA